MVNNVKPNVKPRTGSYTYAARWYGLIFLSSVTLFSSLYLILIGVGVYSTSPIDLLRAAITVVLGVPVIIGLALQKRWAQWLAIALYGIYIFSALNGLIHSFSLKPGFQLLSLTRIWTLRVWRLGLIVLSLIGIGLFFKKARKVTA
jgi:hypothetical protein